MIQSFVNKVINCQKAEIQTSLQYGITKSITDKYSCAANKAGKWLVINNMNYNNANLAARYEALNVTVFVVLSPACVRVWPCERALLCVWADDSAPAESFIYRYSNQCSISTYELWFSHGRHYVIKLDTATPTSPWVSLAVSPL